MSAKWPEVPLGDVLTHRKEFIRVDDAREYLRCRVQLHARGVVLRDRIEGAFIKTKSQQVCRAGEFLVAEIDAKVGGYGIVPLDLDGSIVSSHYFLFTVNPERVDARFLDYYSKTAGFRDQVRAQGSTNYAAIRPQHVLGYTIPLPALPEQRRIVAKIEQLAAKMGEARSLRERAAEARKAVVPNEASVIFETLRGRPWIAIGKLGEGRGNPVQTGPFGAQLHTSDFTDTGVPVLNVGNVCADGLRLVQVDHVLPEKALQLRRYSLKANDLLFARTGATLGKVCLVPTPCDGWLMTGHLFRVRLDVRHCLPEFAFAALRYVENVRSQVFGSVRGATRPGFNTGLLSRVTIPVPSLTEQERIVAYLRGLQTRSDQLGDLQAMTAAALDAMMPAILDRAFKGEL